MSPIEKVFNFFGTCSRKCCRERAGFKRGTAGLDECAIPRWGPTKLMGLDERSIQWSLQTTLGGASRNDGLAAFVGGLRKPRGKLFDDLDGSDRIINWYQGIALV